MNIKSILTKNNLKFTVIKILLLCIFISITCSNKPEINTGLAYKGFYYSHEEQIKSLKKDKTNFTENFILGVAYKQLKKYQNAIYHFANSCFINHRFEKEKFNVEDIIAFIGNSYSNSAYYQDSIYEIAEIYSLYNKPQEVITILSHIVPEQKSLYLDSILLKANSMIKLNMPDYGLALLLNSIKEFNSENHLSSIYLKLGFIYEKKSDYIHAIDAYLKILKLNAKSWFSSISSKLIIKVMETEKISITNDNEKLLLARSLYHSKEYPDAFKIIDSINLSNIAEATELHKLKVRIFTRVENSKAVESLIKSIEKNTDLYYEILMEQGDEFIKMSKPIPAHQIYFTIVNSGKEPYTEKALKLLCSYYADHNYKSSFKYFNIYINKYKENPYSGYLIWLLAKEELIKNNANAAAQLLQESINRFPNGNYSDNCRFWLYKLLKNKNDLVNAKKIAIDLVMNNSDSSYTWILLKEIEKEYTYDTLQNSFNISISEGFKDKAFFYHTLQFFKDKNFETRNKRIEYLKLDAIQKYDKINALLNIKGKNSDKLNGIIKSIEKYFMIGNVDLIDRELKQWPEDEEYTELKYAALAILGSRYNQFFISANAVSKLLKIFSIQENIMIMPKKILTILYPLAFQDCIKENSNKFNISPHIVYSIIRSESFYKHTAVSRSNAIGLMQLIPSTANGIAREFKLKNYNLKEPCTSIFFGTAYFSWLMKHFNGNVKLSLAGYNAGPNFVQRILNKSKISDFDLFIESFPSDETRYYVNRSEKFIIIHNLLYHTIESK